MDGARTITINGEPADDEDALWAAMCAPGTAGAWRISEQAPGLCICTPQTVAADTPPIKEDPPAPADDPESADADPRTMEIPAVATLKGQLRDIMRTRADGKLTHPRPSSSWNASGGRRRNERTSRQGDRQ